MLIKILKKIPWQAYFIVVFIIVFCLTVSMISFRARAKNMGNTLGEQTGTAVGRAMGSWSGMTKGWPKGIADAIVDENTIPDAKAEITGRFQEVGKLEVLAASGTYTHAIKVGKDEEVIDDEDVIKGDVADVYFAQLLSQEYSAVWTVDLNSVSVEEVDGVLKIEVDQPKVEFNTDGSPDIIGEFEKYKNWGKSKQGAIVCVNAFNNLIEQAEEEFENDQNMMDSAKESAKKQIEQLVENVSISKPRTIIDFREEGEE